MTDHTEDSEDLKGQNILGEGWQLSLPENRLESDNALSICKVCYGKRAISGGYLEVELPISITKLSMSSSRWTSKPKFYPEPVELPDPIVAFP